MNSRQLAQVGLGLIGVWALVSVITGFMGIAAIVGSGSLGSAGPLGLATIVPAALLLGLSYVLVFHNVQLAAIIVPDAGAMSEHSAQELARVLVALVGVLILGQAIPATIGTILSFFPAGELRDGSSHALQFRRLIGSGVQVAFALYLIVRPERLLAYMQRPLAEHVG